MADRYVLLKDLPYVKEGAVYEKNSIGEYDTVSGVFFNGCKADCLSALAVENNPVWFKKSHMVINKFIVDYTKLSDEDKKILMGMSERWTYGKEFVLPKEDLPEEKESVEEKAYTTSVVQSPSLEELAKSGKISYTHVEKPSEKKYSLADMEECFEQARMRNNGCNLAGSLKYKYEEFKFKNFQEYIAIYK